MKFEADEEMRARRTFFKKWRFLLFGDDRSWIVGSLTTVYSKWISGKSPLWGSSIDYNFFVESK
jgi:hypothetical protein